MSSRKFEPPQPRSPLAESDFTRPDWTSGMERSSDALWIDKNENCDPEMTAIIRGILAQLPAEAIYGYPGGPSCYARLSSYLGIPAKQLLLSAGSDGAIRAAFEAFVSPGDVVIHTEPTFAMYPVYSRMYRASTVTVSYSPSANGPFLEAGELIAHISRNKPRLVCLPNPDSPTGTVFDEDSLRAIVEAAGEAGAVMLIDEAYYPFYDQTALSWVNDYGHLMVTRTFGKSWALAGLRIGYAAASPEIAYALHQVRPMYETGLTALAVVERLLDHGGEMEASVRRLNEGKKHFLEQMSEMGFAVFAGHGNFFQVAFGERAQAVHRALDGKVLYKQETNHPALEGYSRFSSAPKQMLEPVIELIRAAG